MKSNNVVEKLCYLCASLKLFHLLVKLIPTKINCNKRYITLEYETSIV